METGEGHVRGGVPVVVRGRESRSRGEGGQETDRFLKPEESVDTDARTDKVWLLNVQRKLYQWSGGKPRRTVSVPGGRLPQTRASERRASTGNHQGHSPAFRWVRWPDYAMVFGEPSA